MSGSAGPIIQTDGLVFDYDMSNTKKSWRGAPMPNLYSKNNSNINLNQYNSWDMPGVPGAVSEITTSYGLWNTNTIWRVTVGAGSILGYSSWRQCVPSSFDSTYGTTRRLSAKVKMISGLISNLGLHTGGGTGGATYTAIDPANIPVDVQDRNGWFLLDVDVSGSYPSGHCVGIGILAQNIQFLVAEMMLYPSAVLVPYTPTERLNTQAIVDLTNKNTITASSLTYAADGTFSFNGSNNFVDGGNSSDITITNNITVSAWVRRTAYGGSNSMIIRRNDRDTYALQLGISTPEVWWKLYFGSSTWGQTATTSLALNEWANIVGTYDRTTMRLYKNGVQVQTLAATSAIDYSGSAAPNLIIGRDDPISGRYFAGNIPSIQIYNRALSAAEIQQNFNALRTRYGI